MLSSSDATSPIMQLINQNLQQANISTRVQTTCETSAHERCASNAVHQMDSRLLSKFGDSLTSTRPSGKHKRRNFNRSFDFSGKNKEMRSLSQSIKLMSKKEVKALIMSNDQGPSTVLKKALRTAKNTIQCQEPAKAPLSYARPKFASFKLQLKEQKKKNEVLNSVTKLQGKYAAIPGLR